MGIQGTTLGEGVDWTPSSLRCLLRIFPVFPVFPVFLFPCFTPTPHLLQLLNHMDGTGPPPMAKENIADIPTVEISSEMREKNTSCSVCWEVGLHQFWLLG